MTFYGTAPNIQDMTVIHVSGRPGGQGTDIGDEVTVGHMAVIHACTLEPGSFVGIGSIVLNMLGREFVILMWIDTWGLEVGWMIRVGMIVAGVALWIVSAVRPKSGAAGA